MKIFDQVWGHKSAKRGVFASIIIILILSVLEFPKPIGFETRSQSNVSRVWLILFFAIILSELVALARVRRHSKMGARFALLAGVLNIFQIFADQTHMMQPEVASRGYTLLEYAVGLASLALIYFSLGAMGYLKNL